MSYPPPQPGYGPPHRKRNVNGVLAVVAGVVVGVVSAVLLVRGTRTPTSGPTAPTDGPSIPDLSSAAGTARLTGATTTGNDYSDDLDVGSYHSTHGDWCDESAFPLTPGRHHVGVLASARRAAGGSASQASMQGQVSFTDGRSGTLTRYLRPEDSEGISWCITGQSSPSCRSRPASSRPAFVRGLGPDRMTPSTNGRPGLDDCVELERYP